MADRSAPEGGTPPSSRRRDLALAGVPLALLAVLLRIPGHVRGGTLLGALLVLAAVLGLLGLLGDSPLDLRGDETTPTHDVRPWWRREVVWVLGISGLLYLPTAGVFGLWDPWETHYSEVAREILARDDWITLWWAQEGWFMSKPILIFWMSALGMGAGTLFGLQIGADAGPQWQEWCIRLPVCFLALGALWALYRAVASAWGPRAGALAALVLATMPHWFFLAHQAMTDMPFVASLTIAMSMYLLALTADPGEMLVARRVTLGPVTLRVSLWHLTVGLVLVLVLPQVAYLLTRTVMLSCPGDMPEGQCRRFAASTLGGVQFPVEVFYSGSGGNSGATAAASVVGSPPWERFAGATPFFPSVLQGLAWAALLVWLLRDLARERSRRALFLVLAYAWCAVATLGKGPAGLAIPIAVVLCHAPASGRWSDLRRLHVGRGLLVFLLVGMPWFVAISGRLGQEFLQRFIVHDIINRTVVGVHGDTGSVRYFLWQLGYAMFPWTGLVPAALAGWRLLVPSGASEARRDVARVALLWFTVAFVLFSVMATKFHHYIFPALPGAAVLVGLLLDRMRGPAAGPAPLALADGEAAHYREAPKEAPDVPGALHPLAPAAAQVLGLALAVAGATRFVGSWSGRLPARGTVPPNAALGALLFAGAVALWALGAWWSRRPRGEPTLREAVAQQGLGAAALAAAAVTALVARDLVVVRSNPPGYMRLIHLFVYNYDRPWPTRVLDYRAVLFGFGAVAVASLALLSLARLRPYAVQGAVAFAALFAAWSLDVYMLELTPHWSQRPLFERYYARRAARGPQSPRGTSTEPLTHDPIVAHQMNWKGENFYTGNHAIAMECGLKYCTDRTADWVQRHLGERVFFVTEHSRWPSLLSTIRGTGGDGHTLSTEAEDNKFVLVEARLGTVGTRGRTAPR
ncbi:MAG: hypothetical protein HY909_05940 [Deltaproteobacteria bacterium]|nr:hypothetical protein [Deltaproteobacteria bacterium]